MKPNRQKACEDPVVLEVRQAGDEIAREADYDLHVMCDRLRAAEQQHPQRNAETRSRARVQK